MPRDAWRATEAPTLSRTASLAPMVVFVDGLARSGKSMLGPILASFDRVEIERVEEIVEYLGGLHWLGKIERDAAVIALQMETDMHLYNSLIGRNTNFRLGDHSSVWADPNPWRYLRRLAGGEGREVVERIARDRPIYQTQTHDQLMNFELYHAAFGERLRIVEMIRHPVDLADSWMRRGWGTRFGDDPRALTLSIRYDGRDLPYYALGWERLYLDSDPLARVIRMIERLWDETVGVYRTLAPGQKRQVCLIPFEPFVERPAPHLVRIERFLGTGTTRQTPRALRRQRCPRRDSAEARGATRHRVEREASGGEREILARLIEEYDALTRESLAECKSA